MKFLKLPQFNPSPEVEADCVQPFAYLRADGIVSITPDGRPGQQSRGSYVRTGKETSVYCAMPVSWVYAQLEAALMEGGY